MPWFHSPLTPLTPPCGLVIATDRLDFRARYRSNALETEYECRPSGPRTRRPTGEGSTRCCVLRRLPPRRICPSLARRIFRPLSLALAPATGDFLRPRRNLRRPSLHRRLRADHGMNMGPRDTFLCARRVIQSEAPMPPFEAHSFGIEFQKHSTASGRKITPSTSMIFCAKSRTKM